MKKISVKVLVIGFFLLVTTGTGICNTYECCKKYANSKNIIEMPFEEAKNIATNECKYRKGVKSIKENPIHFVRKGTIMFQGYWVTCNDKHKFPVSKKGTCCP
ncbi:MAG: hypothetical protein KAT32_03495 [Candidatus Moranbacteria bacterium]|nr:hypothetical protein [Candidatus Moranbacteria bacterium]